MSKKKFVDIRNVGQDNHQKDVMSEILKNGDDPFSAEKLSYYHKKPILKESKYWLLTLNQFYTDAEKRILIILREYKENLTELTPEEWVDLLEIIKWANKNGFDNQDYTFMLKMAASKNNVVY